MVSKFFTDYKVECCVERVRSVKLLFEDDEVPKTVKDLVDIIDSIMIVIGKAFPEFSFRRVYDVGYYWDDADASCRGSWYFILEGKNRFTGYKAFLKCIRFSRFEYLCGLCYPKSSEVCKLWE